MESFGTFPYLTTPFGVGDMALHIPDDGRGFRPQLASPSQKDSLKLDRHLMNGVGYLATLGLYLDSIGYRYPYSSWVSTQIHGYPKGAIVTDTSGFEWINTKENNEQDYPDSNISDYSYESQGWQPVYKIRNFSFWPDYNKRTLILSRTFSQKTYTTLKVTVPNKWILVRRTITNWDTLAPEQLFTIGYIGWVGDNPWPYGLSDDQRIYGYEGPQASRFLPGGWERNMEIQFSPPDSSISLTVEVFAYEFEESY